MPAAILTEDLVAIFVILARKDLTLTWKSLLDRLECWQVKENRHFGIDQSDVRILMQRLWYEKIAQKDDYSEFEYVIENVSLRDWILNILEYRDAYFNDESSHWCASNNLTTVSKQQNNEDVLLSRNRQMRSFFSDSLNHAPENVGQFLGRLGIGPDILTRCSRSGASS